MPLDPFTVAEVFSVREHGRNHKSKEARMTRREFLKTSGAGLMAVGAPHTGLFAAYEEMPLRVGLIGSGCYGKTDLLHLMQDALVEVVGLCDVDRRMVEAAADLVATRQPSKKRPPVFGDYRK